MEWVLKLLPTVLFAFLILLALLLHFDISLALFRRYRKRK